MKTLVQAVGNVLSIPLPPDIAEQGKLKEGSELEIVMRDGSIVLTPAAKRPSRLEQLVAQITDENMHELVDWGPPVGGEVW